MKTVVLCGSKRFKPEMRKFAKQLKNAGVIVYEPYLHSGEEEWDNLSEEYKRFVSLGLTHDHFYKIRMADVVFIFNKNGYIGVSTTLEIGFAAALGKPIYALSSDNEISRGVLMREILTSSNELLKKLQ